MMSMCVCVCLCHSLSVRLSVQQDISGNTRAIFTKFFVHVAYVRSSDLQHFNDRPHCLLAGRSDGSAQHGRSVIYNCLIFFYVAQLLIAHISQKKISYSVLFTCFMAREFFYSCDV